MLCCCAQLKGQGLADDQIEEVVQTDPSFGCDCSTIFTLPKCIICCIEDVQVVGTPCGHAVYCENCVATAYLEKKICPLCRQIVTRNVLILWTEEVLTKRTSHDSVVQALQTAKESLNDAQKDSERVTSKLLEIFDRLCDLEIPTSQESVLSSSDNMPGITALQLEVSKLTADKETIANILTSLANRRRARYASCSDDRKHSDASTEDVE